MFAFQVVVMRLTINIPCFFPQKHEFAGGCRPEILARKGSSTCAPPEKEAPHMRGHGLVEARPAPGTRRRQADDPARDGVLPARYLVALR